MAQEFELYRHACAEAGVGVYEQDAQSQFTYVSQHLQTLLRTVLQRDDIELLGKDPRDTFLFSADGPARAELMRRHTSSDGAVVSFEFRLTDRGGQPIWFEARERVRVDAEGAVIGCRGVFIDITARKAAEASSEAKTNFLTAVSHELRTPLNAILGYGDLIHEEELIASDGAAYLARIRAAAGQLLSAIDLILEFSAIASATTLLDKSGFDLHTLVEELVERRRASADARFNRLSYSVEPPDLDIVTDRAQLLKCLDYLLDNAIKFTERGAIDVVVRRSDAGWVQVSIRDSGVGIDAAKLPEIFLPFVQADQGFTRAAGGLGLGLTLAQAIAQKLGGRIEVASEPGHGATFTVHVPTLA